LIGIAGASIWQARTSQATDVSIDIVGALHFLHPTHFVEQQRRSINVGAEHVAVNDMFLTRDGKYVMSEAGPRSARTLAEYGADVLHITSPSYPDTFAQHLGVDIGKRCAYLDLRNDTDLERMHELASGADVFTTTYRGAVNQRFGLDSHELAARSNRGIVCMTANA